MKKIMLFTIILVIITTITNSQEKATSSIPDGYDNVKWGEYLSDVKPKIKGKLTYTDEKKVLISKDLDESLEFYYGFFYVDNKEKSEESATDGAVTPDTTTKDEGKLTYVVLKFPYLSFENVKKKLNDKYGKETRDNLKNNRGAVIWESEKTIVMMWVDDYEKKPYCRRLTYVSKDFIKELDDYKIKMFNKVELNLLKNLNP